MTRKPQSTISYNSENFLRAKLLLWEDKHIIQRYFYIKHIGEDGDKDHIHLHIVMNSTIDVMNLKEELREYIPGHVKPLGITWWQDSDFPNWLLYALHDPEYMKEHYSNDPGEKIPYELSDIRCSEDVNINLLYARAKAEMKHSNFKIANRLAAGESAIKLVLEGANPQKVNAIQRTLSKSDYERMCQDYAKISLAYHNIIDILDSIGYYIDEEHYPDIKIIRPLDNPEIVLMNFTDKI